MKAPMACDTRSLEAIYKDFDCLGEQYNDLAVGGDSENSVAGNLRELTRTIESWDVAPPVGFGIPLLDSAFKGIYPG
ncbi:hypothetical protein AGMMS50276_30720 [Synergistales bacterium]|nr:hypothetical protein AGMMS50276_30720 [Synergistales bacterium]